MIFKNHFATGVSVVIAILFAVATNAQSSLAGLLGHYTFCDCTAKDNSPNHLDGIIMGNPTCVKGSRDYGLLLNQVPGGSNGCGQAGGEYIRLPTLGPVWSQGITVCAWIRFDEIKNFERIFDFSNGTGESGGMAIWFGREGNSNNLTLESWINSDGNQARSTGRLVAANSITNGAIEYYCATISGNIMSIYVNGQLVAQKQGNPIANVNRSNNYLGHSAWCGNDPDFKGFMDEVRVYNRALSPAEINSLYQLTNINDFSFAPVCGTKTAAFSVTQAASVDSVKWNFNDPISGAANIASGFAASHVFTDTGTYAVQAIVYKYCLNDTVVKNIHIGPYNNFLGNDFNLCSGNAKILTSAIQASAYQWQDGSSGSSFTAFGPGTYWLRTTVDGCNYVDSVTAVSIKRFTQVSQVICNGKQYAGHSATGTYIDTLKSSDGCDSIRTLNLTVMPYIGNTVAATICNGEMFRGYKQSGTYHDSLRAANGCDSIVTINLTVLPAISTTINAVICRGQSFRGYTNTGNYVDTLKAVNGCDSLLLLQVTVLGQPVPMLPTDTSVCKGGMVKLFPGVFNSYTWQDGSTDSTFTATQSGKYSVSVSNTCGTAVASTIVNLDSCLFVFPTAFTPDNNGVNDEFKILSAEGLLEYRLVVYDRWGQKQFETTDFKKGWNGITNGQRVSMGVYVWTAFIKTADQSLLKKGTVVLIR